MFNSATIATSPYTLYFQQIQQFSPIDEPFRNLRTHSTTYEPIPRLMNPFHDLRTHDKFFAAQACFFRFLFGSGSVISPSVSYSTPSLAFLFNDCTHQILCQDRNPDRSRVFTSLFLVSRAIDGFWLYRRKLGDNALPHSNDEKVNAALAYPQQAVIGSPLSSLFSNPNPMLIPKLQLEYKGCLKRYLDCLREMRQGR